MIDKLIYAGIVLVLIFMVTLAWVLAIMAVGVNALAILFGLTVTAIAAVVGLFGYKIMFD